MQHRNDKFPTYEQVYPDVHLIGIRHRDINRYRHRKSIEHFKKKLRSLDHLAFEGNERSHRANSELGRLNYEQIALRHFQGQKHFLEENSNYLEILEKQGVSHSLFGMFKAVYGFASAYIESSEMDNLNMRSCLELAKQIYPGYNHANIESIVQVFPLLMADLLKNNELLEACYEGAIQFNSYLTRVRDHAIYVPGIEKLRTDFEGQIGVVLGLNHVGYVRDLLLCDIRPEYIRWKPYTEKLDTKPQNGIRFLEEFVKKHFESSPAA